MKNPTLPSPTPLTLEPAETATGAKAADNGTSAARAPTKIDRSAFRKEREVYWKTEAKQNPVNYSPEDLAKMEKGRAPKGPDGHPMELHHVDRTPEGGLQPMSRTVHRLGANYQRNHPKGEN